MQQYVEVVLVNNLLGDTRDFHLHAFVPVQWGVEIHIADIHCHLSGIGSGDDAVEVHFECFEAGSFCADIAWVVKN